MRIKNLQNLANVEIQCAWAFHRLCIKFKVSREEANVQAVSRLVQKQTEIKHAKHAPERETYEMYPRMATRTKMTKPMAIMKPTKIICMVDNLFELLVNIDSLAAEDGGSSALDSLLDSDLLVNNVELTVSTLEASDEFVASTILFSGILELGSVVGASKAVVGVVGTLSFPK